MDPFLAEWERWAAEVLGKPPVVPVVELLPLAARQPVLAGGTDRCPGYLRLIIAGVKDVDPYQAQLTFAMSRHAVVDLALVFKSPPSPFDHGPTDHE